MYKSNTLTLPRKYPRITIMTHKITSRHDAYASDEFDLMALSRGHLVQMVIDLR